MSQEILEKVCSIVSEQLSVETGEVKSDSNFQNDLGADYLDTVELVMALEEAFDIEIPDEAAEGIATVGDAVKFIEEKKASFEAILIPMVGFSESYKRLGRGGGFYDRYVENLNKKIIKIGIAYKYQRIKFDEQEFDMKFDQIIVSD